MRKILFMKPENHYQETCNITSLQHVQMKFSKLVQIVMGSDIMGNSREGIFSKEFFFNNI